MKATYRRKYLKRRIMYSYGHPGSFNPAVIGHKEAHMTYDNMNNETRSSRAAGFCKKTRSNISAPSGCWVMQTEALTDVTSKEKKTYFSS